MVVSSALHKSKSVEISNVEITVPSIISSKGKRSSQLVQDGKKPKSSMRQTKGQFSGNNDRIAETEEPRITLSSIGIVDKSPIEFELEIQCQRILFILDSAIKKIQVVACLPVLLKNNGHLLRIYLKPRCVEYILDVCSKYHSNEASTMTFLELGEESNPITQLLYTVQNPKSDEALSKVVDILSNCRCLMLRVQEKGLPIAPGAETFIQCMKNLLEAARQKLSLSAVEEREREKELRQAYASNLLAKDHIQRLQDLIDKQRADLGVQLTQKLELVAQYNRSIDALQSQFKENVKKRIHDSEMGMAEDTRASEVRQAELAVDAKNAVHQYQSLLEQHLAHEKGLRAKRFKVETQLASWLSKYDADIGERQAEFEELTKAYDEEKAEMDALQERFDEQEEEYEILMAEKEEDERLRFEEMAYEFLLNRSARRIQRCWRAYKERKLARKRARKAKAKAKKERAESGEKPPPKPKKEKPKKGSAKGKKGKKVAEVDEVEFRGPDPMAALQSKFKGDLLDDIDTTKEFSKTDIKVDLSEPKDE